MKRHFKQSPDVVERTVREARILVPLTQDTARLDSIYTLNATAALIWDRARSGVSEPEIAAELAQRFDVDAQRAAADVATILNDLVAMKALTLASSPDA